MVTLTPSRVQQFAGWTRTKPIAFRFAFALSVLCAPRLAVFITPHLFDPIKQPIRLLLSRCDVFVWHTTTAIGAFFFSGIGGRGSVHDQMLKFNADWDASVFPDLLGLLILAIFVTLVWTLISHHKTEYSELNRTLRVYLRYGVGMAMLSYAFIKVIPTQFGYLTPGELLVPFGQLSRFRVMWDFMAASPGYTIFAGLVELVGALLLFFRRTTLLGSLVLAGALIQVIVMDLAFNVGAVTSANAIFLLDLIILAPYALPLFGIVLVRGEGKLPAEPLPLRQRWWHSPSTKMVVLCVLILPLIKINIERRRGYFGAGEPVYGLFSVSTFVRNGQTVAPMPNDGETWKRVGSDPRDGAGGVCVEFANGDVRRFALTEDKAQRRWTIRSENLSWAGSLHYEIRQNGDVSLDGRLGSDSVDMVLRRVDESKFFQLLGPT